MTKRAAHYTPRIGKLICLEVAMGAGLQEALDKVGYLAPTLQTCWRWIDEHQDFRESYERARLLQADIDVDDMRALGKDIRTKPTLATAYRVAIDVLKWTAERGNRVKYGSNVEDSKSKKPLNQQEIRKEIARLEGELGIEKPADLPKGVFTLKKPRKAA